MHKDSTLYRSTGRSGIGSTFASSSTNTGVPFTFCSRSTAAGSPTLEIWLVVSREGGQNSGLLSCAAGFVRRINDSVRLRGFGKGGGCRTNQATKIQVRQIWHSRLQVHLKIIQWEEKRNKTQNEHLLIAEYASLERNTYDWSLLYHTFPAYGSKRSNRLQSIDEGLQECSSLLGYCLTSSCRTISLLGALSCNWQTCVFVSWKIQHWQPNQTALTSCTQGFATAYDSPVYRLSLFL